MWLERAHLIGVTPQLRALFSSFDLDVTPYSNDALVGAVLAICPVADDQWPSDEQARRIFEWLR